MLRGGGCQPPYIVRAIHLACNCRLVRREGVAVCVDLRHCAVLGKAKAADECKTAEGEKSSRRPNACSRHLGHFAPRPRHLQLQWHLQHNGRGSPTFMVGLGSNC
eukprot:scaffold9093_cov80-Phaeocystis_antarctica.AAC.1